MLEVVTNTTIKTAKAYSSAWDNHARFKEQNIMDVTITELKKSSFNQLVIGAPTVDISNLNTEKVRANDNVDRLKEKIRASCQNIMKVAQDAIENNPSLERVTVMNHAPRYDTKDVDPIGLKPNLANFANNYMLELWMDSPIDKIFIGSHNLECSGELKVKRYKDDRTGWYDGVHLYGSAGKMAYTESVLNILLSSFPAQAHANTYHTPDDSHTSCPQSKYTQQKKYSSAVRGNIGPSKVKTQNRFSPLGGISGNC